MRQLDMADLKLYALAADYRKVLAPVELECLPGAEGQRNKGAPPRRVLLVLLICFPLSRKGRHTVVGAGKAKSDETACIFFSVCRSLRPFFAWVLSQPVSFSAKGSSLLDRSGVANCGSITSAFRYFLMVLRDTPMRRSISRIAKP